MPEKNPNEQDQPVGNADEITDTDTSNNVDVDETPATLENGTELSSESSDQESSTPNPAEQHPDLSAEINHTLSELLEEQTGLLVEKLNSGNQTLDEIKEDIEDFKENNLLEAKSVIHHLIQFYDSFARLESQFAPISGTFESVTDQIDAIPDTPQSDATPDTQIDAIKGKLESVKGWVDSRLSEEDNKKLKNKIKRSVEDLLKKLEGLRGMLPDNLPPSQEDTVVEDGSVAPPEESKDSASSLSQANTEMTDELIRFRNNLENALYEFKEVLARIDDVVPYKTVPDETSDLRFDRKKHTSVDSKRTDDKAQHLQVAESHKAGFYRGEKQTVFRPEEVTVYRYEEPTNEPIEADEEAADDETVTADTEGTTEESSTPVGNVSANKEGDE